MGDVNNNDRLTISKRLQSFKHAFRGIATLFATQHNAILHLIATITVGVLGLFLGLSLIEWAIIALTIAAVLAAEAFNTAIEFLGDAVSPDHHPLIGNAKDVAAGAVLIVALGALAVGLLVFVPHFLDMFRN